MDELRTKQDLLLMPTLCGDSDQLARGGDVEDGKTTSRDRGGPQTSIGEDGRWDEKRED